jgi:hypothetical protein
VWRGGANEGIVAHSKYNTQYKVGFFEVVTPLLSRGVVFARDSPHLLSLFGKKPDITGKSIILGVRKTLV